MNETSINVSEILTFHIHYINQNCAHVAISWHKMRSLGTQKKCADYRIKDKST